LGKGIGRPPKLNAERQERILQALRAGNYVEVAARYGGIGYSTMRTWIERGEKETDGPYRDFMEAVEKARAEAEVGMVAVVKNAARTQWQAAAWWLERSFPARWGRRDRTDVDHSGTVTLRWQT
jgi:transposase